MDAVSFKIDCRLPSLNEYVNANRTNPHAGAKIKKDTDELIAWYILAAKMKPVDCPIEVHLVWYEATYRRDPDNIAFAIKFILDALVTAHILKGDSRKYIKGIHHDYGDSDHDFVVVNLIEY